MSDPRHEPAPPSPADGDGVRVQRKGRLSPRRVEDLLGATVGAVLLGAIAIAMWWPTPAARREMASASAPQNERRSITEASRVHVDRLAASAFASYGNGPLPQPPSGDPPDLASYFRPGDAVPETANLIEALRDAGVREGIAAFNPPGTSPPLAGLAVPDGFELPSGFVRHHQSMDDGTLIEPILMFSPDLVLRDAQGRVIPLPENLVVPPGMAPPGLPLRWVQPGKP